MKFYLLQKTAQDTQDAFDAVNGGLLSFVGNRGYYPCPADPTLARGDANYGRESARDPVTNRCIIAGGVAARMSGLDQDSPINVNAPFVEDRVLVGAVPFATMIDPDNNGDPSDGVNTTDLKLRDGLAYDGWGRKLTYAVSENLTVQASYNDAYGSILVIDENSNPIVDITEDANRNNTFDAGEDTDLNGALNRGLYAHYVLISHGQNGMSGYTSSGAQVMPCPAALPIATFPAVATPANEVENCDAADGTFLSGLHNDNDHSFNDDLVNLIINQTAGLWTYANSLNQIRNTNAGNVGFGTNAPDERLDIAGNLRAQMTQATGYCDTAAGANALCLLPETIGGTRAEMQCPSGQIVINIENNRVNCADPFSAAFSNVNARTCPAGCVVGGFQKIGTTTNVICRQKTDPTAICP